MSKIKNQEDPYDETPPLTLNDRGFSTTRNLSGDMSKEQYSINEEVKEKH